MKLDSPKTQTFLGVSARRPQSVSSDASNELRKYSLDVFFTKYSLQIQWDFQDPKMEVLYHIRPCFVGIFPYIGLT